MQVFKSGIMAWVPPSAVGYRGSGVVLDVGGFHSWELFVLYRYRLMTKETGLRSVLFFCFQVKKNPNIFVLG